MKKIILIIIIVLVVLLIILGGILLKNRSNDISDSDSARLESDKFEKYSDETTKQLEVIAKNFNIWSKVKDYANDSVEYTITDLDHNDRLEVVVTQMGGTGKFSYNYFYEVDSNLTFIDSCKVNVKDDSNADLSLVNNVFSYYDNSNNIYYYIVNDAMQSSPNEYYEGTYALSLKDGTVNQEILASKFANYDYDDKNGEEKIFYMDKEEKYISKDQYDAYVKDFYKDFEKSSIKLKWSFLSELEGLSEEEIINKLKNSLSL